MKNKDVVIFTDGASKGNPGPGGWGAVISDGKLVTELGGGDSKTTNNEMELIALLESLKFLKNPRKVKIYVDSRYVLNGVTSWIPNWEKNDWKTSGRKPVLHREIWQRIDALLEEYNPRFEYIPGHAGIDGNEAADRIAQGFASGDKPKLFKGTTDDYEFDLNDLKKKYSGASDKKKRSSAKAYSYVSVVNGLIKTHKTWAECEKRVKGTPKARFKKALSKKEEEKLIKEFRK